MDIEREPYGDLERARQLFEASEFDALLVALPENVAYLSGFYHPDTRALPERLHLVVWVKGAPPVYIVPRARADNWNGMDSGSFAPEEYRPAVKDVRGYAGEHLAMVDVAVAVLRENGLVAGSLGTEFRTLPQKVAVDLRRQLPGIEHADAWPMLNAMRQVKTAREIEVLTQANTITARTLEEVLAEIRPGQTERDVAARIVERLFQYGAEELSHCVLSGGARTGGWHPWPGNQVLEEGMLIRADWGVRIDGYTSDIARTAVVGRPSAHQADVFARISEVHDTVIDALAPGVVAAELVQLARSQYARLGLEYRWGLVGHGIGLVLHEEPQLTPDYFDPIVDGMVMEIELGWVDPHEGYHVEDLVLVKSNGAEKLTGRMGSRSLLHAK